MTELLIDKDGYSARLTINRPEKRNSLSSSVINDLCAAIDACDADASVRVIILTGAGEKAFCAGADLSEKSADGKSFFESGGRHPLIALFEAVERCGTPIVGRVNGHALGGGLGLVCLCDIVVASDHALLGTPEAKVGVFPMMILSYLMRQVPERKLREMALTATPISAVDAIQYDLVNHAVPMTELDSKVEEIIKAIAANSPTALRLGKKSFREMQELSLGDRFDYSEKMIARMSQTQDGREGMKAFLEKRKPEWATTIAPEDMA